MTHENSCLGIILILAIPLLLLLSLAILDSNVNDVILNVEQKLSSTISNMGQTLSSLFSNVGQTFSLVFSTMWTFLSSPLSFAFSNVGQTFTLVFSSMETFLSSVFSNVGQTFSLVFLSMKTFLSSPLENVGQTFSLVFSSMETFLSSPLENLFSAFSNVWGWFFSSPSGQPSEDSESGESENILYSSILLVSKFSSEIITGFQNSFNITMGCITSGLFFLFNNVFIGCIQFFYWSWSLLWSSILSLFLMITSVFPSPDDILVPVPKVCILVPIIYLLKFLNLFMKALQI